MLKGKELAEGFEIEDGDDMLVAGGEDFHGRIRRGDLLGGIIEPDIGADEGAVEVVDGLAVNGDGNDGFVVLAKGVVEFFVLPEVERARGETVRVRGVFTLSGRRRRCKRV